MLLAPKVGTTHANGERSRLKREWCVFALGNPAGDGSKEAAHQLQTGAAGIGYRIVAVVADHKLGVRPKNNIRAIHHAQANARVATGKNAGTGVNRRARVQIIHRCLL